MLIVTGQRAESALLLSLLNRWGGFEKIKGNAKVYTYVVSVQ